MPIYVYFCPDCGKEQEIQSSVDSYIENIGNYPTCDCGSTMARMISNVSISFKGKGFHKNDYKKKK